MIKNIHFIGTKMSDKFPLLAEQMRDDIKYEIKIKGILHPYLYVYFDSFSNKYLLRIRIENQTHTLVACSTLQEARKNFYLYHLNSISGNKTYWRKWNN